MFKFPATRRVLFHHLVNVLLIEFKLSAGLAKHLAASPGRAYTGRMVDKTYLVCLKPPSLALQHVDASRFEIHGEHLVFVDLEGKLAALFLMELVSHLVCLCGGHGSLEVKCCGCSMGCRYHH
jgi:hypothetical protein